MAVKAIAHASCSLKPAEQNYSQIEKEGLALIFAIRKLHKYIYRRHFTLLIDHRPPPVDIWEPQGHSSSFS
jgi:hypothetical protein